MQRLLWGIPPQAPNKLRASPPRSTWSRISTSTGRGPSRHLIRPESLPLFTLPSPSTSAGILAICNLFVLHSRGRLACLCLHTRFHPATATPPISCVDSSGKQKTPERPNVCVRVCCEVASCDAAEAVGSHPRPFSNLQPRNFGIECYPSDPASTTPLDRLVGADTTNSSVQARLPVPSPPCSIVSYPSSCAARSPGNIIVQDFLGLLLGHQKAKALQLPVLPPLNSLPGSYRDNYRLSHRADRSPPRLGPWIADDTLTLGPEGSLGVVSAPHRSSTVGMERRDPSIAKAPSLPVRTRSRAVLRLPSAVRPQPPRLHRPDSVHNRHASSRVSVPRATQENGRLTEKCCLAGQRLSTDS